MDRVQKTLTYNASETVKQFTINENGHMTDVAVVMPNFTNAITGTLTIEDEAGVVLYTKATIAENATTVVNSLSVPVDHGYVAKLTLSGAAGGTGGDVSIKLWVNYKL